MARVPAPWATRVDVFRRYDVDAGNVSQVLNWCLEAGDAEAGLRICAAVSPCWIVWGTFGEGGEWLRSLLALDMTAVRPWVRGAAMVVRAQLALSSDPAAASSLATDGLKLCREAGDGYWTAVALNLLSEIALHTGQDRRGGGQRGRGAVHRAGGRRRLERGLRAGHPGGDRGPGRASSARPSSWPPPRSA